MTTVFFELNMDMTAYRFIKAVVERIKVTVNQIDMFLLIGSKRSGY